MKNVPMKLVVSDTSRIYNVIKETNWDWGNLGSPGAAICTLNFNLIRELNVCHIPYSS